MKISGFIATVFRNIASYQITPVIWQYYTCIGYATSIPKFVDLVT